MEALQQVRGVSGLCGRAEDVAMEGRPPVGRCSDVRTVMTGSPQDELMQDDLMQDSVTQDDLELVDRWWRGAP